MNSGKGKYFVCSRSEKQCVLCMFMFCLGLFCTGKRSYQNTLNSCFMWTKNTHTFPLCPTICNCPRPKIQHSPALKLSTDALQLVLYTGISTLCLIVKVYCNSGNLNWAFLFAILNHFYQYEYHCTHQINCWDLETRQHCFNEIWWSRKLSSHTNRLVVNKPPG